VSTLYDICAFELSNFNNSRFCQLFSILDIEALEYGSDLRNYYQRSTGNPIHVQWSAGLLQKINESFGDAMADPTPFEVKQKAHIRFTHESIIFPLTAILNLDSDPISVMKSNSSEETIQNRKFRTSKISPFASNLAFVLYNCSSSKSDSDFRVRLIQNEQDVYFPGCDTDLLCPIKKWREIYSTELNIDFHQVCKPKPEYTIQTHAYPQLMTFWGLVLFIVCSIIFATMGLFLGRYSMKPGVIKYSPQVDHDDHVL